ncbi:6996_t:CDS:2 [Ambispora gerdemannii]|uniref:6996_t:CDS:1 n=1 Tax=Ambispora gerdemannii TaxID=144530 RepID=A0A9N9AM03_9GLOM|nr:6996_t:CDS:2 [Ambispora gerdemannii]
MSVTASNTKPNPYITHSSVIRFGPDPFTDSTVDNNTTTTVTTTDTLHRPFERRYTPISPSPLAQSEMSYHTEEPVLAELLPNQQQPTPQRLSYYNYNNRRERKRTCVENNRKKQFFDKIDQLDLSDIYGGITLHHESPYDCVLPYRNGNAQAPVLAFQQSEENNYNESRLSFQPSQQFDQDVNPEHNKEVYRKSTNNRYTAYDPLQYMDSFLEGSTAYGIHPEGEEDRRGSRLRERMNVFDNKKPNSPRFSRAISSPGEETSKRYTGLIAPTQLFNRFRRPSTEAGGDGISSNNNLPKHGRSISDSNMKSSQANNSPLQPIQPRSRQESQSPPLPVPEFSYSIQDENNNHHKLQPTQTSNEYLRPNSRDSKKKGNNRTSWVQRITSIGR